MILTVFGMVLYCALQLLGRPTYMQADLYFTTDSFFLLSIFRQLPSALAEQNSTKTGYMLGSERDLKMDVRNLGYPIPLQIGGPKTTFFDDFAT